MPGYDSQRFDPPAPIAEIVVTNPINVKQVSNVSMLIDTGAVITLIPQTVIDKLDVEIIPDSSYELIGFGGNIQTFSAVRLELLFCGKTFRGQFLPVSQEWGILGSNILNKLSLLYEGPALEWNEQR